MPSRMDSETREEPLECKSSDAKLNNEVNAMGNCRKPERKAYSLIISYLIFNLSINFSQICLT